MGFTVCCKLHFYPLLYLLHFFEGVNIEILTFKVLPNVVMKVTFKQPTAETRLDGEGCKHGGV